MEDNNSWDVNLNEVVEFIKDATIGKIDWKWYRNSGCKYISLRIDMRDGTLS